MNIYIFVKNLDQFSQEEKKILSDLFDECQFQSDVDWMIEAIEKKTGFYSESVKIVSEGNDYVIAFRMIAGSRIRLDKDEIEKLLYACRPYLEAD